MMASTPQPELFRSPPDDPNVAWLEGFLKAAPDWWLAADICAECGWAGNDARKRQVRQLASASEWIVSGQAGYKHLSHCTPEEIHHSVAWMLSQAKKMSERACAIQRNAHRVIA